MGMGTGGWRGAGVPCVMLRDGVVGPRRFLAGLGWMGMCRGCWRAMGSQQPPGSTCPPAPLGNPCGNPRHPCHRRSTESPHPERPHPEHPRPEHPHPEHLLPMNICSRARQCPPGALGTAPSATPAITRDPYHPQPPWTLVGGCWPRVPPWLGRPTPGRAAVP